MSVTRQPSDGRSHLRALDRPELVDLTIPDLLARAAATWPDQIALVAGAESEDQRYRWTNKELLDEAERAANVLQQHFAPGERIAIWAPNVPQWILLQLGAATAGLVLVTVNPSYRASELEFVLKQSRSSGIFLAEGYRGTDMRAILDEVLPAVPDVRVVQFLETWGEFVGSESRRADRPHINPHDPAMIQYTSGTTGFPKGATLTHHGMVNNALQCAARLQLSEGDTWLNPNPLFHGGGSVLGVLGTLGVGATNIPVYIFKPDLVLELIELERPTVLSAVTTMVIALLEHPDLARRDVTSLRTIMSGGSSVPAELVRRIESTLDLDFTICYGQTEASISIAQTSPMDDVEHKSGTVGVPLPGIEVRVASGSPGHAVPLGEVGEIQVRGFTVMAGYFDQPERTSETIDDDGWLRTGDLGTMDDDGYLRITGRLKEMIIRGGENLFPAEIEGILHQHPAVVEVAVVGVPDDYWGEQVAAVIRHHGDQPEVSELRAYIRQHLAPHKTPTIWRFVDDLPKTASGKIQKFVLRKKLTDN